MDETRPRTWLNAAQLAELFGVTTFRIYDLVREDRVPHIRIGRQIRFVPEAIEAWAAAGGQPISKADDASAPPFPAPQRPRAKRSRRWTKHEGTV